MTRTKVKLQLFAKESERRISFKKRKKGLIKKLEELTTLCDIEACAIISSPFEANMEVWPSHNGVHKVLTRLMNMAPTDQTKKMFNQESYIRERIQKASDQWRKLWMENRRIEIDQIINNCLGRGTLGVQNDMQLLNDMDLVIRQNIQEIDLRIQSLEAQNSVQEMPTSGMQAGESSNTNVDNFMSNDGGENPIFTNVGPSGFI